ncbi:oligogalacturonate lyase family protein [Flavobacterium haoranii]|nr:oligogalacturonate lyase family protein [Flavobacterium haoranii]
MPDGKHILYASTHEGGHACPAPPKSTDGKYLWAVYPEFDIYVADLNGKVVKQLTNSPGYDAEAVVSPDGKKIVFTSTRSGDLELWIMDIDGSNLKQLTDRLGYDGGAFFSHDSKKLVFRSSRPKTAEAIAEYKDLLSKNLVAPTEMEIYTINIDGTNLKQVTHLGKANWAPYFHPSDKKIIFSSNHHSTRGYDFQLFMIDEDGKNLRQITWESEFNAFPMFSPDGKKLVFSSNRQQSKPRETNVFIADWVETDEKEVINDANLKGHIKYLASDELEGRLTG